MREVACSVSALRPFSAACRPCSSRRYETNARAVSAGAEAPGEGQRWAAPASSAQAGRRQLLLGSSLLAAAPLLAHQAACAAEEGSRDSAQQAFFEVKVDGKPVGRFVVEIFGDAGVAAQRFADLSQGKEGVGYRRSRFELLEDSFIQDSGVKELSRRASGESPIAGGPNTELLEEQLQQAQQASGQRRRLHDAPGLVSLVVLPRREVTTKDKLVAVNGQLVNVTETFGEVPNGTAWAITTQPAPELDATNLVVGRVVEGMEVVQQLAALPRVANNKDSPFFKAGKAAGDKRADVAERAFGKPFAKIVIERCGLN